MRSLTLFCGAAIGAYGVSSLFGDSRIFRFYSQPGYKDFIKSEESIHKYTDFKHSLSNFLDVSKVSYDEAEKKIHYLYYPTTKTQGFPGVCHGGFSYSMCLTLAGEYIKHFGLNGEPVKTYMKYSAPIKTENVYKIEISHSGNVISADVIDQKRKKHSLFTATLVPKGSTESK